MPDGSPASTTKRWTWSEYSAVKGSPNGVMLGDGLGCWDLDDCFVGGVLEPWAESLVAGLLPSALWVERSLSGNGLHVFVEAPEGPGTRRGQVEFYSRARFIAVSGDRWFGP